MSQIIFVTGTDTGVGKTLVTALLLTYLRRQRRHVLAMKPFCSGGLRDARILFRAQSGEISLDEICPFSFAEPVAPLAAARRAGRTVQLPDVLRRIRQLAARCELLLVEGAGGLLVPLGEGFTAANVITALACSVLLVARNKLGAINHTILTYRTLQALPVPLVKIAMTDTSHDNLATETNGEMIRKAVGSTDVLRIPFLGRSPASPTNLIANAKKLKKTLARFSELAIFTSALPNPDKQI
jgi:dethiobiotin synthetase